MKPRYAELLLFLTAVVWGFGFVGAHMALEVRKADAARVGLVVGATKSESIKKIRAAELENGYSLDNTAWVLAPGFGRQGGDLSFVKYAGPNAIYPISSGLTNPKYLNGMTPADAAKKWRDDINAAASDGYYMKSISEYFIDDLVASDIMWIAPSADTNTWRILRNKTKSPIYWDVRNIQSYPALRETASYLMTKKIIDTGLCPSQIAAVPYGALCLGMDVARNLGCSVITPRKDGAKDHGDCNDIGMLGFFGALFRVGSVADGYE